MGPSPRSKEPTDHLLLLAGSPSGYRALSQLVSTAQFRGEKDRPVYQWDDLVEASANPDIFALSGCRQGAVARAAAAGDLAGTM